MTARKDQNPAAAAASTPPAGKGKKASCPICKKEMVEAFRPFCSKRCADVDLHRWLGGHYAIPVTEEDGGMATGSGPPLADNEND